MDEEKSETNQIQGAFYPIVENGLTKEIQREERYLIRWIQARNFDLKAAEEFLRAASSGLEIKMKNLEWRKSNKMDTLLSEKFSVWERRYPFNFLTHDHEGRPAVVSALGQIDVRKIVLSGLKGKLDRYVIYAFEQTLHDFHGKNYTDGYLLFNMAGYNARSHACLACVPSWVLMVQNYERYYPRLVRTVVSINTPRIFQNLVALLKPFFTEHTAKGLRLYGINRKEFRRELLKAFPKNQLFPVFGGTFQINHTNKTINKKLQD